jgi:hypothetical protein
MWTISIVFAIVATFGIGLTSFTDIIYAQSSGSSQNVTSTILKKAGEDLAQAIEALRVNNVTGAVNEARSGVFYLEMLGIPSNCILDDNEMLQCGFPR